MVNAIMIMAVRIAPVRMFLVVVIVVLRDASYAGSAPEALERNGWYLCGTHCPAGDGIGRHDRSAALDPKGSTGPFEPGTMVVCQVLKQIHMSTKSSLAIALTALAAGAALGVLLAPRSGAETRKKIMRKRDALKDRLNEMLREGEELLQDLKGEAETAAKEMRAEANSVK